MSTEWWVQSQVAENVPAGSLDKEIYSFIIYSCTLIYNTAKLIPAAWE